MPQTHYQMSSDPSDAEVSEELPVPVEPEVTNGDAEVEEVAEEINSVAITPEEPIPEPEPVVEPEPVPEPVVEPEPTPEPEPVVAPVAVNGVKSSEPEPPAPEPEYTVASSPQPKKSMGITQPLRSRSP